MNPKLLYQQFLEKWEKSFEDKKNRILFGVFLFLLLVSLALFFVFVPSSAAEVPTDLTGYSVTVPANWSAESGYGLFHLEGNLIKDNTVYPLITTSYEDHNFGIGYYNDGSISQEYPNEIGIHAATHAGGGTNLYPSHSFELVVTGGSSASSSSLINWFVNNNASFELAQKTDIVSGEYQFNESIALPSDSIRGENLSFTAPSLLCESSTNFNILSIGNNNISVGTGQTLDASLYDNNSWVNGFDRYLYFNGPQNTSLNLYNYLTDNGTFTGNDPDPDPDPEPSTPELFGRYDIYFSTLQMPTVPHIIDNILFYDLNMTEYNAIRFQKAQNEVVFESIAYRRVSDGAWVNVLFREYSPGFDSVAVNQEGLAAGFSIFFEDAYTVPQLSLDIMERNFNSQGYDRDTWGFGATAYGYGFQDGFADGYNDGFAQGYRNAELQLEGSFLGNIVSGVVEALDNLAIFGEYSLLDVIKILLGAFVVIWFLKVVAGG